MTIFVFNLIYILLLTSVMRSNNILLQINAPASVNFLTISSRASFDTQGAQPLR